MSTKSVSVKDEPKHYPVKYSIGEYTFATSARVEDVRFDDRYMHIELVDERIVLVPLKWIPSLRDAAPAEREKYKISPERTMIIWDPDEGEINEILRIADYLGPA